MKKNIKIIFFILVFASIFMFAISKPTFAAINLNINNSTSNSETSTGNTNSENLQSQYGNELDNVSTTNSSSSYDAASSSSAEVSNLSSIPESNLGLSNILSILLIAVGIILILLGIAVLIRLKK